jgi:hypothetical protein
MQVFAFVASAPGLTCDRRERESDDSECDDCQDYEHTTVAHRLAFHLILDDPGTGTGAVTDGGVGVEWGAPPRTTNVFGVRLFPADKHYHQTGLVQARRRSASTTTTRTKPLSRNGATGSVTRVRPASIR